MLVGGGGSGNNSMTEYVVLVDEQNQPTGTADKAAVHTVDTPLHRGFSVFIFNSRGEVLLQQRSHKKLTWPLAWSNSCCGHPALGESTPAAARRRMKEELGLENVDLHEILPNFRYRAEKDGILENEFCPVMVGFTDALVHPNPNEVESIEWVAFDSFLRRVNAHPESLSPWCVEEAELLSKNEAFLALYART